MRHRRIEMRARQRPEYQDQHRQHRAGRQCVAQAARCAPFPPASRSAMMPEPTTAASRNAVPSASAASAARQIGGHQLGSRPWRWRLRMRPMSRSRLCSVSRSSERDRQRVEYADPLIEHPVGVREGQRDFRRRAVGLGRIGNSPMRRHRLAGPDRAGFAGRIVADGEDEIELRRTGLGELVPGFGAEA